ncbi:MAG: flagellar hook-length control protein FliK [Hydrogenothermaceae bacterium]|nr:flagellar hook-length control protein FliK [Hydrogenothermaceae bacterium]
MSTGETVKADVVDILPSGGVVLRIKDSYVTVKTEVPLTKENQLLLKVLELKNDFVRLQIIDIKPKQSQISENVNQILQTDPELLVLSFDKLPPQTQKEVINFLQNQLKNSILENFPKLETAINPQNLTVKTLKKAVENSGIFFENKLLNLYKNIESLKTYIENLPISAEIKDSLLEILQTTNINNYKKLERITNILNSNITQPQTKEILPESINKDISKFFENIKSQDYQTLLKLTEDNQLKEKIKAVIDSYQSLSSDMKLKEEVQQQIKTTQELSIVTESFYGFLPINWEGLKNSTFKYKKTVKDNGKSYHFIVNLDFEDGKVSIITSYRKEKIDITLAVENQNLRNIIANEKINLYQKLKEEGLNIGYIEVINYAPESIEKVV